MTTSIAQLIDPTVYARVQFRIYRYRFLLLYILFGVVSLFVEVLLLRAMTHIGIPFLPAYVICLGTSIFIAYWLNARFNFKIPASKRNRALIYFAGISCISAILNYAFRPQLLALGWSFEQARFGVSAVLFSGAYVLHRRISFVDRKQVGVAVYANGVEDIREIRGKIKDFPDFIHVDLIDASFGAADTDVRSYRLEAIQAYWQHRKVHVHLMTRHPSRWLNQVLPFADLIIVHHEIDEPIGRVLDTIHAAGRQAGLCLTLATPVEAAQPWIDRVSVLMLLSIAHPGQSGQSFELKTLEGITRINAWPGRQKFALCVDGGVNEQNIQLLNVELVVSGSSVLRADDPARQIMRLQTSSNYEAV